MSKGRFNCSVTRRCLQEMKERGGSGGKGTEMAESRTTDLEVRDGRVYFTESPGRVYDGVEVLTTEIP